MGLKNGNLNPKTPQKYKTCRSVLLWFFTGNFATNSGIDTAISHFTVTFQHDKFEVPATIDKEDLISNSKLEQIRLLYYNVRLPHLY